ncbi:putative 26S proteasome complex ubiquitin receptor [Trypanosoma rangeli]|uniref:Putative 26S proteasome complex ubiquitin receptor n=1 Tax=Trypanosoma rangeli TaxID=5698 RepID=A0A422MVV1_TRYRA|nr:putative 26S proteasome complex ubiquitin receptor [Trypanosoma rangeli]RNE97337.1 putative 26S proteasome complex ubiquitin receptor [Trypanosoma rangeli]|eukprot:RNE97337.1 putative 26S proteasome complex ubiquitin receptor [Trypanosoma rangeli]
MELRVKVQRKGRGGECVIQFRAGKMIFKEGKVEPDRRRGTLSFFKMPNNDVKMTWISGSEEEQHILPRGEVKFSQVEKCTTGRVFLFDFGTKQPPIFFWLQEKSTENDSVYLSTIHELIGEENRPNVRTRAELDVVLQDILRSMRNGREQDVDLVDIIGSKKLLDALHEDPAFFMFKLHQFLPEGTDPTVDVVEQVRNPQVSAAAASLGSALRNPLGFREICTAFGVSGSNPSVFGFLSGVIKLFKK